SGRLGLYDKTVGTGTRYLTTAGHCPNTLSYTGVNLPIKGENYQANTNNDFQWHTTAGFDRLTNQIYDGLSTNYTISYVYPYSSMATGDFVCKYGAITGYTCGTVTSKNYNFIGASGFVVVRGVNGENMSDPGDSGGPWYNDEYAEAWGSHSDSSRDNGNDGVFMPISNISASNLAVLTTP
ncbi:S1 family peptidase, partial [Sphingobium sp. Z007]|uniref:S1 family peptidase n=1 Tax=Sphingobium sp. Z007 TaxID=627495 RepID=UPI001C3DC209